MKEKRGKIDLLVVGIVVLVIASAIHITVHFALFGTGVRGLGESGISGLSIGKLSLDDASVEKAKESYSQRATFSKILIGLEWIALAMFITLNIMRRRTIIVEETSDIKISDRYVGSKTDIDVLYDILQEKKRLRVSTIERLFKVKNENVMDWAKILESNNLAEVNYPNIGEPEVVIKEVKNESSEKSGDS